MDKQLRLLLLSVLGSVLVLGQILAPILQSAPTYYVDAITPGSDSNPGSKSQPFATLAHALAISPNAQVIFKYPGGSWYSGPPVVSGLLAMYPHQQGGNSTVLYDAANGYHMTVTSPTWSATTGLQFGGSTYATLISTPAAFNFERTNPFTVVSLFSTSALGSYQMLLAKQLDVSPFQGWSMYINFDGTIQVGVEHSTTNLAQTGTFGALTTNTYTLASASSDGGSTEAGLQITQNGAPLVSSIVADSLTLSIQAATDMQEGSRGVSHSLKFTGTQSGSLVYNRRLSAHEMYLLYQWEVGVEQPRLHSGVSLASLPTSSTALLNAATNVLNVNKQTFTTDSTAFWASGLSYRNKTYSCDLWPVIHSYPGYFTSSQISNLITKFVAVKDGSGNFPLSLKSDATVDQFESGYYAANAIPNGDSAFFLPLMESIYYQKSGDNTIFTTNEAAFRAALSNLQKNGTTHLITISATAGQGWVPWSYREDLGSTGDNLIGSLFYYQTSKDLAARYAAIGDSTHATFFSAEAANVAANISTLWDSTDGMFYASSGNNKQIDVIGSAFAVYLGVATAPQTTAIGQYLTSNYSTLVNQGFIRNSPTNWAVSNLSHPGDYEDGYWAEGNEWVAYAIYQANPAWSNRYIAAFLNGSIIDTEYWPQAGTVSPTASSRLYITNILSSYAWAAAHPGPF